MSDFGNLAIEEVNSIGRTEALQANLAVFGDEVTILGIETTIERRFVDQLGEVEAELASLLPKTPQAASCLERLMQVQLHLREATLQAGFQVALEVGHRRGVEDHAMMMIREYSRTLQRGDVA
jgi:hypothetical protein